MRRLCSKSVRRYKIHRVCTYVCVKHQYLTEKYDVNNGVSLLAVGPILYLLVSSPVSREFSKW
ncbi:hypothetical protein P167DRAFT_531604 [Morchella conica CCBAS932]|uniref:Uncharacterized protein n=1 Tax=Morchella conica CCBAS932 TaxID=1392247 RepID=A0A3N4L9P1_9PEZI|nr:hypothetical protein P167DRAFT_531604 [Morchella conica CCBAS932]